MATALQRLCAVQSLVADEHGFQAWVSLPKSGTTDAQLDAIEAAMWAACDSVRAPVPVAVGDDRTGTVAT